MKARFKLWIEDDRGEKLLGIGLVEILETIDRLGSINRASKELKMSYRACWGKIKDMERRLGKTMVETSIGGGKKRGATLTSEAQSLVAKYNRIQQSASEYINHQFDKIFNS